MSLRRLVTLPVVMDHSLKFARRTPHLANGRKRWPDGGVPRARAAIRHPAITDLVGAKPPPPLVTEIPVDHRFTTTWQRLGNIGVFAAQDADSRHNPQAAAVSSPARIARETGE
ncbi:hypothetical protein MHEI_17000 [Mycobacterium heidelbergense]|nr:hypothetical protein MHEI_17000 [Mycobacterium heidelbergense]